MRPASTRLIVALSAIGAAALVLGGAIAPAAAGPGTGPGPKHDRPSVTAGALIECASLTGFQFADTTITGASVVVAGTLSNAGKPIGEHCLVTGSMNERVSPVDGKTYAIGFEMRLPRDWSGRYLYQANGGLDGNVVTATGGVGGGESGLQMGMAVISSDAGHNGSQNPTFGIDPQARLDYGYQAVGTLTPMAKALVTAAYGRGPDASYFTGGSNGGRHTMVAAARYADQYDGFLAVAPGFNLPEAALAQMWGAQQWASVATNTADLNTAFTPAERRTVATAVLARCDGLDGLVDGMVQASDRCDETFSIDADIPGCAAERDGTCLTIDQKRVLASVLAGARTSDGESIYASFPLDPGLVQGGWGGWKLSNSVTLDPMAYGFTFASKPESSGILANIRGYALGLDIDAANASIRTFAAPYTESAMSFMTPPDATRLDGLVANGGKLMVVQGLSDGVFSPDDTEEWFEALDRTHRGKAERFARYFEVPGMGHVAGGPATDRYAGLAALIDWVERGVAPDALIATVNPGNGELPAEWSKTRSRPLCVYPAVATYRGGDVESASSFVCTTNPNGNGNAGAGNQGNGTGNAGNGNG